MYPLPYQLRPMGDDASSGSSALGTLFKLALVGAAGYALWRLVLSPQAGDSLAATPRKGKGRAAQVKVKSEYEEDQEEDLRTAVQLIDRGTMKGLERSIRKAGFKDAMVWGSGDGFIVGYNGEEYPFSIEED